MCKIQLQSCQIFRIFKQNSSSVAEGRMRGERGEGSKEDRDGGDEGGDELEARSQNRERKKDPPPHTRVYVGIVLKTGRQMSVLTKFPLSSLSPLPGPQLWCMISRASRIWRS